jgi:hypothetical protein
MIFFRAIGCFLVWVDVIAAGLQYYQYCLLAWNALTALTARKAGNLSDPAQ